MKAPEFQLIGAHAVARVLHGRHEDVMELVAQTYRLHGDGRTTNPDSYFLRFPERPDARIIALPARIADEDEVAGIKWIASFPGNHEHGGLPRASAVVILNDMATGFPLACIEGSAISANRTAASAALAARLLHSDTAPDAVAVIGSGPIARQVVEYLRQSGWRPGRFRVHDLVPARAEAFRDELGALGVNAEAVTTSAEDAVRGAGLVVLATTAAEPWLADPGLLTPDQTVLNVSLRDLAVPVILAAQNVLDDVEHCMKANTSPHLAEQATGGRDFVAGTVSDLIEGRIAPDPTRPRIFSPFGLGVLDLALARFIHHEAGRLGLAVAADDFFGLGTGASAP
ncbi:2,3-diaminopropionate biosynthesis protein SbnB [Streptomyces sp. NBC_01092]|uniref:2,3-diaminopropionate biosynthesis protein SbnB n=1 Tax=Streptomyces sp. NBC_01092 TaxID=2903748 RepID=UPI0038662237|nr:2,3-diaminopropionate biosynthesis protein SbnB [Streptomyces sp. NBC_01092]